MTTFESEASIEEKLIHQLVEGESQWTFRGDIHTFDDLWNNFRKILIQNNKEIFDEHPLTDSEFQQVQNQLRFPTFYDAAQWLMGENGIVRVSIQREDAELGTVYPVVFKRADVAGGSSVYEVVHQIEFDRQEKMNRDRRGDVTLLINGLPMIQIELKNRSHPYREASIRLRSTSRKGLSATFTRRSRCSSSPMPPIRAILPRPAKATSMKSSCRHGSMRITSQ